jgi:hypothetical protein
LKVDHWITECWQPQGEITGRWVRVDAQIDNLQREKHSISFNTHDLPPESFYTAGEAWLACRAGQAKSGDFGHNSKLRSWNYLRQSLLQDFGALNKMEVLPWDTWWDLGMKADDELTPQERALLDRIALLTAHVDDHFEELRTIYEGDTQFSAAATARLKLREGMKNGLAQLGLKPSDLARLAQKSSSPVEDPGQESLRSKFSLDVSNPLQQAPIDPEYIVVRGAQQHNLSIWMCRRDWSFFPPTTRSSAS